MADKSVPRKKTTSKKPARSAQSDVNRSYEHHLEKWLENTSKMNFDYSHHDGNWPFMNAPNAFQPQPSRKGSSHLQQSGYSSNDPISLPSHIVSFTLCEPTFVATFVSPRCSLTVFSPLRIHRLSTVRPQSRLS